jgi:thiamine pyrophosphokinase
MSSHHFVKEKQEPALLILSDSSFEKDILEQLLEWSPIVIVEDKCLMQLNHEPIKIDYVLQTDLELEEIESWVSFQDNVRIIDSSKSTNKIKFLIDILEREDNQALSIIGHSTNQEEILKSDEFKMNIIFYSNEYKTYTKYEHFKKWKEIGSLFDIIAENISTKNLLQENSLYEVMEDGTVEINSRAKMIIKEYIIGANN